MHLALFERTMSETFAMMGKQSSSQFLKNIDPVNTELIFNSLLSSFEKLHELIDLLEQHKVDWKNNASLTLVSQCLLLNDNLFKKLETSSKLLKETTLDLQTQKGTLHSIILSKLNPSNPPDAA